MLLVAPPLPAQLTVPLSTQTSQAFDDYVKKQETSMSWQARRDTSPIQVPDGLIHDWVAQQDVPGATVEKAVALLQNYAAYKRVFAPDVLDSKVLEHDGNRWRVYLQLRRKAILTVVLNTEYEVEYRPLDGGRWEIVSHSTKVVEVEDGKELAPDAGHGYLWRLHAYWLIEPTPKGVRLNCRAISLTRDIPTGLGWMLRPIISNLPRDSLRNTLESARNALR